MTQPLYVVAGIPRSGTSMVMHMLQAGGVPVIADATRTADADNPLGYFELAATHTLHKDNGFVSGLPGGVAVKVISFFLKHLPAERDYAVVHVVRDVREVLASQRRMLERRGEPWDPAGEEALERSFREHVETIAHWMDAQPNFRTMRLDYGRAVADPEPAARELSDFCRAPVGPEPMAAVVDQSLYRNRTTL